MANKLAGQRAKYTKALLDYHRIGDEERRDRAATRMAEVLSDAPKVGFFGERRNSGSGGTRSGSAVALHGTEVPITSRPCYATAMALPPQGSQITLSIDDQGDYTMPVGLYFGSAIAIDVAHQKKRLGIELILRCCATTVLFPQLESCHRMASRL